jgi:mRNA interferase RelE/StbE
MVWRIELAPAAEKELRKLGHDPSRRILTFLSDRLAKQDDPRTIVEALKGSKLGELWKYRVGDYRVIADIRDAVVCVLIIRIAHRRHIYRR